MSEFVGPQGNENWLNMRESLTEYENAILDNFNIIQDRTEYVRPLRPFAAVNNLGSTAAAIKEEAEFKKDLYNKCRFQT